MLRGGQVKWLSSTDNQKWGRYQQLSRGKRTQHKRHSLRFSTQLTRREIEPLRLNHQSEAKFIKFVTMSQKAASSTVPITVMEIEEIAKTRLPKNVYDYYACGADEQKAMARNAYMFDR